MKGDDVNVENTVEETSRANEQGRPERTTKYERPGGLAVLAVAAAIGLAACGGGRSTPHVASLGTSTTLGASSGNSTGTVGGSAAASSEAVNPTALMDEWAACMRTHGDPNQADPVIDAYGVINITMSNVSAALSSEVHGSSGPCSGYELAAQNALRAAHPVAPPPDQAQLLQYVG
jgi:hypothetical protein